MWGRNSVRKPRALVMATLLGLFGAGATAGLAVGAAAPAGAATASLVLSPVQGGAGKSIGATLANFGASQSVTLNWDAVSGPVLATTTTDASGAASTSFTVPAATHGNHVVFAVGSGGTPTAAAAFRVGVTFLLSRASAPAGKPVTGNITGFNASQSVTLNWGTASGPVLGTTTTDANGGGSVTFTVPAAASGTYSVFATGAASTLVASAPLKLLPQLAVSPVSAGTGHAVVATVGGFKASQVVTLNWDAATGPVLGTFTADANGAGTKNFTVPAATHGNHVVFAVGSGGTPSASTPFKVGVKFLLSRPSAPSGKSVTGTVNGFNASQSVTLNWNTATGPVLGTTTTDADGTGSVTFTVPAAASGTYSVWATGAASSYVLSAPLKVVPSFSVLPFSSAPGRAVVATVTGFQAARVVTLNWNTAAGPVLWTFTTVATGGGSKPFTVPAAVNGAHAIFATGAGGVPALSTTLKVRARLSLAPNFGPAGTSVTATLSGYNGSQAVTLKWGSAGGPVLGAVTTGATGSGTVAFIVPASAKATYTVYATGSGGAPVATTTFAVT